MADFSRFMCESTPSIGIQGTRGLSALEVSPPPAAKRVKSAHQDHRPPTMQPHSEFRPILPSEGIDSAQSQLDPTDPQSQYPHMDYDNLDPEALVRLFFGDVLTSNTSIPAQEEPITGFEFTDIPLQPVSLHSVPLQPVPSFEPDDVILDPPASSVTAADTSLVIPSVSSQALDMPAIISNKYLVPSEQQQKYILQQGPQESAPWLYWMRRRLVMTTCGPLVPLGHAARLLKKNADAKAAWEKACNIAREVFFNSRSAGALASQLYQLKKAYKACKKFQDFTSTGNSNDIPPAEYDRSLPVAEILSQIDNRLKCTGVQGITSDDYLAWTFDTKNGLFALMDRQFGDNLPIEREPSVQRSAPPHVGESAAPPVTPVNFASLRNPPSVIDEDSDSVTRPGNYTPASSLVNQPSAVSSHSGRLATSGSTRPTSLQSQLGRLSVGFLPPMPTIKQSDQTQAQVSLTGAEHRRYNIIEQDVRGQMRQDAFQLGLALRDHATKDLATWFQTFSERHEHEINELKTIASLGLEQATIEAEKGLLECMKKRLKAPSLEEWQELVERRAQYLRLKINEDVERQMVEAEVQPSDSASTNGDADAVDQPEAIKH